VSNKSLVEGFFRVFRPFASAKEIEEACNKKVTLEELYAELLPQRFIPLKDQQDVHYPEQRTKEWFEKRKKVPSTITGSRPAGWFFDISNPASYREHLAYVHEGKKQHFSPEAIKRMNRGTKYEDYAQSVFLEYFVKTLKSNIYIYETGFQRNSEIPYLGSSPDGLICEYKFAKVIAKRPSRQFEEEMDYLAVFCDDFDTLGTFVISGEERYNLSVAQAKKLRDFMDQKEALEAMQKAAVEVDLTGWDACNDVYVYGGKFSILEIKAPQKGYSSIPYYYMCQLHSEMAAFNLTETYFMCWFQKNGEEKLRVWKLKFNPEFWKKFLQIVDLFRLKNYDNTRGAPWSVFGYHWFQFKMQYSRKQAWEKYVKPYFEPRKHCLSRPYVDPFSKKNSE